MGEWGLEVPSVRAFKMNVEQKRSASVARVPRATVLNRDGYRVRPRPRPRIPRKPSADEDENADEEDGPSTVSSCTPE